LSGTESFVRRDGQGPNNIVATKDRKWGVFAAARCLAVQDWEWVPMTFVEAETLRGFRIKGRNRLILAYVDQGQVQTMAC
jgi:hypothetical protein